MYIEYIQQLTLKSFINKIPLKRHEESALKTSPDILLVRTTTK